jgi:hypothetical protein
MGAAFHGSMRRHQRAALGCRRGDRGDDGAVFSGVVTGEEGDAETADGGSRSTKETA